MLFKIFDFITIHKSIRDFEISTKSICEKKIQSRAQNFYLGAGRVKCFLTWNSFLRIDCYDYPDWLSGLPPKNNVLFGKRGCPIEVRNRFLILYQIWLFWYISSAKSLLETKNATFFKTLQIEYLQYLLDFILAILALHKFMNEQFCNFYGSTCLQKLHV